MDQKVHARRTTCIALRSFSIGLNPRCSIAVLKEIRNGVGLQSVADGSRRASALPLTGAETDREASGGPARPAALEASRLSGSRQDRSHRCRPIDVHHRVVVQRQLQGNRRRAPVRAAPPVSRRAAQPVRNIPPHGDEQGRITAALDRFSFGDAGDVLRNAFWTGFCDFYIEAAKTPALAAEPETRRLLAHALDTYLRLFHPFIPFVTEDIWERIGGKGFLMHQSWPIAEESDEATAQSVEVLIRAVTAIRNWRVKQNLKWNVAVGVRLRVGAARDVFERCAPVFQQLASVRTMEFVDGGLGADAIEDQAFALTVELSPEHVTISPQNFQDA
jgi:hypothetical protein